jgi:hypothetical protein
MGFQIDLQIVLTILGTCKHHHSFIAELVTIRPVFKCA